MPARIRKQQPPCTRGSTAAPGTTFLADGLPDAADRWSPELGLRAMSAGLRRANGVVGDRRRAPLCSVCGIELSETQVESHHVRRADTKGNAGTRRLLALHRTLSSIGNSTHADGLGGREGGRGFEDRIATCACRDRRAAAETGFCRPRRRSKGNTRSRRSVAREGGGIRSTLA